MGDEHGLLAQTLAWSWNLWMNAPWAPVWSFNGGEHGSSQQRKQGNSGFSAHSNAQVPGVSVYCGSYGKWEMFRTRDDLKVWVRPGLLLLVEACWERRRSTWSLENQLSLPVAGMWAAAFVLWVNRESVHLEWTSKTSEKSPVWLWAEIIPSLGNKDVWGCMKNTPSWTQIALLWIEKSIERMKTSWTLECPPFSLASYELT